MRLRRALLNLVLVAAAILLSLVLWLEREQEAPPEPVTPLARDAISGVRVSYPDALDLVLRRDESGWRLESPVATRAEDSEVSQILRLAQAEVEHEYPAEEIDPAEVGLDEPAYTVTFTGDDGREVRVELGGEAALERSRYARVGDTVYLVEEPNMHALGPEFSILVARRILPEDAEIEKIELPEATLSRTDTGGWTVTPGEADRGADAAQRTVDAWRLARAMWMKPADNAEPEGRVRLHLADGTVRELAVVARKPQLILRDPELAVHYHVAANEAAPLLDMAHGSEKSDAHAKAQSRQE